SATENLMFWAKAAGLADPAARVKEALETVGLSRHAEERAGIFSRGMAQRLNLARLMLADPQLILLDEPATGLDTASRRMLLDLMLEARSQGAAILWISHDVEEDSRHADRVLTLKDRSLSESAGGAA
ncbi:MAG: ATP-binding cassette domain-containing protein, partial [Mailhella sp.]|nr:ATP-binding cassette domain-containing protein [Mailhella sp.]